MKHLIIDWLKQFYKIDSSLPIEALLQNPSFQSHQFLWTLALFIVCAIVFFLIWYCSRLIMLLIVKIFADKTKTDFDNVLLQKKFFKALAHIIPLLFLDYFFSIILFAYPDAIAYATRFNNALFVIVIMISINRLLDAVRFMLQKNPVLKDKPIGAYTQTIKIVFSLVFIIILLSVLTQQSPLFFLTSLGAMTAIILLIFKDTILGFVGSIQISVNDMVRMGDWVQMDKYGADGDVVEINLTTVKVKNWDNTVTTVPTYSFISDSFKNWREMSEGGGRRIKRSIHIKVNTIKFADNDLLDRLSKVKLLADFIQKQNEEFERHNKVHHLMDDYQINALRPTNIGLFRRYIDYYLKNNKELNQNMWLVVRLLQETDKGLPVEIWCNSKNTSWLAYEKVLGDIFDHLYAVIDFFELEVHQSLTGSDLKTALGENKG